MDMRRQNKCSRKEVFLKKKEAVWVSRRMQSFHRIKFCVYQCEYCYNYHVGRYKTPKELHEAHVQRGDSRHTSRLAK